MENKKSSKPNIYQMELHSCLYDKGCLKIIRVPGGWLYFCEKNDQFHGSGEGLTNGIFVPYNDQFYIEDIITTNLNGEESDCNMILQDEISFNLQGAIDVEGGFKVVKTIDDWCYILEKIKLHSDELNCIRLDEEVDCNNGLYSGNALKNAILNYDLKENECYTAEGRNEQIKMYNKIKDYMDNNQPYASEPDLESTNVWFCTYNQYVQNQKMKDGNYLD